MLNQRFGNLIVLYKDSKDPDKVVVRCDCGHPNCVKRFRILPWYLTHQGLTSCSSTQPRRFKKRYPLYHNPTSEYHDFYNYHVRAGLAVDISEAKYFYLRGNCQSCGAKTPSSLVRNENYGWYNHTTTSRCEACIDGQRPARRIMVRRRT